MVAGVGDFHRHWQSLRVLGNNSDCSDADAGAFVKVVEGATTIWPARREDCGHQVMAEQFLPRYQNFPFELRNDLLAQDHIHWRNVGKAAKVPVQSV